MPTATGQRFDCHSCTRCCRELVVGLTDADRARIDQQNWVGRLDMSPYVKLRGRWVLNSHADGRCVFLLDDGRCRIHAEYGLEAKPVACRFYPFTLNLSGGEARIGWRFECPTIARSAGRAVGSHARQLRQWARELEWKGRTAVPLRLRGRMIATPREVDALTSQLDVWLSDDSRPMNQRLAGAAHLTTTLGMARLRAVRGERFAELVALLMSALPDELGSAPAPVASPRQRAMLRQLAFAHAEHVSAADLRRSVVHRLRKRWTQLRMSRQFRLGAGPIPLLPGLSAMASFEAVEAVAAADTQQAEISDCIVRYLRARTASRSCMGRGYYGWSVLDGLDALWLSVAAIGWLARVAAAGAARPRISYDDVITAVGVVDRGAGRAPALGSVAERLRLRFLRTDAGIRRLLVAYSPI
ncbi:MAG TPA: YkgJ family cysteine cluster protein [Phycisphaerae bacterium]